MILYRELGDEQSAADAVKAKPQGVEYLGLGFRV